MQDGERWIGRLRHWDGAHFFDDAGRPIDGDDVLRRQAAMLAPNGVVLLARGAALVSDSLGLEALALHPDALAAEHPTPATWLDKIPPAPFQPLCPSKTRARTRAWRSPPGVPSSCPPPTTNHPEIWLVQRTGCLLLVVPGNNSLLPLAWLCAPPR